MIILLVVIGLIAAAVASGGTALIVERSPTARCGRRTRRR